MLTYSVSQTKWRKKLRTSGNTVRGFFFCDGRRKPEINGRQLMPGYDAESAARPFDAPNVMLLDSSGVGGLKEAQRAGRIAGIRGR
jgi:hypothetical protein